MFKIKADFKQLNKFIALGKSKGIGVVKRSMRATVNDQAWSTQKIYKFKEIPGNLTTRGKFNQSLIRVDTAKGRSLTSETGAINKSNYFGLKNIELGKKEKNAAIPHLKEVRGGRKSKKVTAGKRLGKLGTFKKVSGAKGKRTLSKLSRTGYTGHFQVIGKSTKLSPGIYRFSGKGRKNKKTGFLNRKILMVRNTEQKTTAPRKIPMLWRSSKSGASQGNTFRFWSRNLKKNYAKAVKGI